MPLLRVAEPRRYVSARSSIEPAKQNRRVSDKPFVWTESVNDILAKVGRAREALLNPSSIRDATLGAGEDYARLVLQRAERRHAMWQVSLIAPLMSACHEG